MLIYILLGVVSVITLISSLSFQKELSLPTGPFVKYCVGCLMLGMALNSLPIIMAIVSYVLIASLRDYDANRDGILDMIRGKSYFRIELPWIVIGILIAILMKIIVEIIKQ